MRLPAFVFDATQRIADALVRYRDETSLLLFAFVPEKFQSMCDRNLKLQSSLSDYEISLMKHHGRSELHFFT